MPIYPYSFQLPPLSAQDIPNNGAVGEFLGISAGGVLDWLPVVTGGGDMLKAENLSGLANYTTARTNIGLGTTSTPTFANLTLTSPSLASSAPVTISQTWGALAQTFTALKVNAAGTSDANSASGSRLLDLQLNGVSKLSITKAGTINFGEVQANFDPYISRVALGTLAVSLYGFNQNHVSMGYAGGGSSLPGVTVSSGGQFAWSSNSTNSEATRDTILLRDSPTGNTLALRNGGLPQTFNIYNTYQNAGVDYERIAFKWSANLFTIGREFGGTGGARNITIVGGGSVLGIGPAANAAVSWTFSSNNFLAGSDNQYDIGTSGANRPRNVYVGTSITSGSTIDAPYIRATSAGGLQMQGRFFISSAADGNIYLTNNAATDFGRLQFGGTTNLFPAIKRNGAGLQIRLADDSANATLEAGNLYASGNVGIGTTSPTSKLHVAGSSSPSITVDNTLATGASQLLFKNTVVTGDTDGIFLNGSAQSGFGGNGSLNIKATSGPIAFHTNTVTNALSIAQNGVATFAISIAVNSAVRTSFINNIGDSLSMFNFVNDNTGTSTYAVGGSAPLMRFGGTTNLFPAIKRSATTLQIRLANDSNFAPIQGKLTTETAFTATTVTPTGFITLYDSTGAAYKVPCVPA